MKSLFSRLTSNNDVVTAISSANNQRRDGKDDKVISTSSFSDKYTNGASLYAEPQDLLYPSSTATHYASKEQKTTIQPRTHQHFDTATVRANDARSNNFRPAIGDAPKSTSSADPALGRRGTKTFFETLRGRKTSSAIDIEGSTKSETRTAYLSPSSHPKANSGIQSEIPIRIAAVRSQSTPAVVHDIVPEVPPPLPAKSDPSDPNRSIPQHPLSYKAQRTHQREVVSKHVPLTKGQGERNEVTQQSSLSVSNEASRSHLHFLEAPPQRQSSKSAPTTPQLSSNQAHSPAPTQARVDEVSSLRKTFSKRSESRNMEQKGEERKGSSLSQSTSPRISPQAGYSQAAGPSPDLASELNELAVAHKEGLLGEEEYRLLRQSVFEKMMGRGEMEVPREGRLQSISRQTSGVATKEDDSSVFSGSTSKRSRDSSTSKLASLFRRGSRSNLKSTPGSSSLLSTSESINSNTAPSMRSQTSASTNLETQISEARRARTLHSGTSVRGIEASSTSTRGQQVLLSVNRGGQSLYCASGASISSGNALLGANYTGKSADEIEAEIAVVEAEGKRILERFRSLQINALGRYNLSFTMLKQALEGIGLESELEADVFEDYVMIEKERGGKEVTEVNGTQSRNNGTEDTISSRLRRKRSFGAKSNFNGRRANKVDSTLAPSSYKGVTQQALLVSESSSSSNGRLDEEDPELIKLRAELKEIMRRRSEVAKKYADRLAFLRSTLRSAKIRQGLK